jgi:hypothetical protein
VAVLATAGLADEQIPAAVPGEDIADFLSLPVFKRAHNQAG